MTIPTWLPYLGAFVTAISTVAGIVFISRIKPRSPKDKGEGE